MLKSKWIEYIKIVMLKQDISKRYKRARIETTWHRKQ